MTRPIRILIDIFLRNFVFITVGRGRFYTLLDRVHFNARHVFLRVEHGLSIGIGGLSSFKWTFKLAIGGDVSRFCAREN